MFPILLNRARQPRAARQIDSPRLDSRFPFVDARTSVTSGEPFDVKSFHGINSLLLVVVDALLHELLNL